MAPSRFIRGHTTAARLLLVEMVLLALPLCVWHLLGPHHAVVAVVFGLPLITLAEGLAQRALVVPIVARSAYREPAEAGPLTGVPPPGSLRALQVLTLS